MVNKTPKIIRNFFKSMPFELSLADFDPKGCRIYDVHKESVMLHELRHQQQHKLWIVWQLWVMTSLTALTVWAAAAGSVILLFMVAPPALLMVAMELDAVLYSVKKGEKHD